MTIDALQVLTDKGAVFDKTGCYFVSTVTTPEGRHNKLLKSYVSCEVIFPYHDVVRDLTEQMMRPFLGRFDVLICAATGDISLLDYASYFANHYGYDTLKVWADKQADGSYKVERMGWAALLDGKRVLVVNDRLSQGGTTRKVIDEVRRLGGEVIGVTALSAPSTVTAETLGVPEFRVLCVVDVDIVEADQADADDSQLPVAVDVGHGEEFREENPDWPGGFVTVLTELGTLTPA